MKRRAAGFLLLVAACADPPAAAPAAPVVPVERAIIVDGVKPLPLPLVRGSVAGRPTLMAVDTGTGATVIASWLARAAGLATTAAAPTRDPSGRAVAMTQTAAPHVVIDGLEPIADRPTPVVELPAVFESAGIGVILSPQALATAESMVIIDLPRHELRRAHEAPPDAPSTFAVDHTVLCRSDGGGFDNRRLTASVTIDGMPTVLEVDTGAFGDPLFLSADTEVGRRVLARAGASQEHGLSAAGALDVTVAHGVPAQFGNQERLPDVTVIPGVHDTPCGVDGRLGIDWLRACVFTIGEHDYRLRCILGAR